MVSSVCEEPARSEVELLRLWLHTRWEGWATATPTEGQPAVPQLLAPRPPCPTAWWLSHMARATLLQSLLLPCAGAHVPMAGGAQTAGAP